MLDHHHCRIHVRRVQANLGLLQEVDFRFGRDWGQIGRQLVWWVARLLLHQGLWLWLLLLLLLLRWDHLSYWGRLFLLLVLLMMMLMMLRLLLMRMLLLFLLNLLGHVSYGNGFGSSWLFWWLRLRVGHGLLLLSFGVGFVVGLDPFGSMVSLGLVDLPIDDSGLVSSSMILFHATFAIGHGLFSVLVRF